MKLLKTFRAMLRHGMPPPNVMIRGFAGAVNLQPESKEVGTAFGLLKSMTEKSVVPNLVSFNAVVQGLCEEGRIEEAQKVVEEMNRKGLAPDENTYMSLFELLCDKRKVDKARKVLSEMIDTGFSPSVATYKNLIHWSKVEEAVGILRDMHERGLSPDVVTYNTLISKFCTLKEPELEKALEMKAEMVHKGILPDADTYYLLIRSLCLQQRLSEAFDLFREMLRAGVSPEKKTYAGLMNAYRLEGQFSKAFQLQDEMIHKGFLPGISPTHVTYNTIIHGLCLLDRAEEALGILRGMPKIGLSPDAVSYCTVISGFCRIREPGKAYKLKVEMDKKRISWLGLWGLYEDTHKSVMQGLSDEDTFSNLMSDYLAEGNLEKAYNLEREINDFAYLPVDVHYSVFLNGLNKKARITEAKEHLLWFISHVCLRMPTFIIYDTLIENCCNNEFKSVVGLVKGFGMRGLVNKAARAHDTMLEGNYKPDGAVYNLLIFDHCRCSNVHKAYDMYMDMAHYGFDPHMFSVLALIEALYCVRRYNRMSWVIQNTLRTCNLNDSELLQVLNEIDVRKGQTEYLRVVLAEIAIDGPLLDGGKCSYASASTVGWFHWIDPAMCTLHKSMLLTRPNPMKLLRLSTCLRNRLSPPNVIIRGFTAVGNLQSESKKVGGAFELLKAGTEKGVESNSVSGRRIREAEQVVDETTTYNALVLAYCCDERVDEAMGILRCMTERGLKPNLISFNAVVQGLCGKGRMEEAEEVVEEMNQKDLAPDERTYTSLIHLFCDKGHPGKARKVLSEMIDSGFSPSVATYNRLIRRLRLEDAVGVFRGMTERDLSPDVVTYNTLISKFCKLKEPDLEKAFEMKAEMVHKGILPDADTYEPLIRTLCLQQRLSEAYDLFREMLRWGVSPNNETYTGLMNAYRIEGQFSKAFHLQDEMTHKGFLPGFVTGFSPSHVTYNAIIYGLCLLGRAEEALGVLRGMPEIGLSPDAVSYCTVILGFCRIREPGKAYELKVEVDENMISWLGIWGLFEDTRKSLMQGLSNEDTFSSLMNDYLAQGNLEKAFDLKFEMSHYGYLPEYVYYSIFVNGLNKKARTREAKEHLLFLISHWHLLYFIIYDSLIENCSNNEFKSVVGLVKGFGMRGLVNEAARARVTMFEGNYKPDGAVYNLLIFEHSRCRNVHKAYDMYMEMVHYGFAPHMFSVRALIWALYHGGRYNKMIWVIQNTLRSCNLNDSELLKVLNEIDVKEGETGALEVVLAEIAMDGLLLDGGKCSYASART
ncbi:pentatricopeptide repeat-containing protein At4g31850, chloroplastic-like [Lotus japonicus]|uniref:pentatricopeptide repeat-containing protein At4g31850, chloroplastic-like n=1 Tax=Lotus japonicus TaxID=34305 RepID=UPI002585AB01|nr:pentatricopeptide repeat-containing protein At4g31850, chloroplastic-like [Lotus japonicus]